jgi:hypothetical protein
LIYELFNEKILRIFFLKNGKTEKKIWAKKVSKFQSSQISKARKASIP